MGLLFGKKDAEKNPASNSQIEKLEQEIESKKKELDQLMRQKQEEAIKAEKNAQEPLVEPKFPAPSVEQLQQEIIEKDKKINTLESRIMHLQECLTKDQANPKPQEEATNMPVSFTALEQTLALISGEIKNLSTSVSIENQRLLQENAKMSECLEDKQLRLEQIVQTCQEDRYRKDKVKLINKYIYQIDLIRKTQYDFSIYRNQQSEKEAIAFLESQLTEIIKGMEATLLQEMVENIQTGEEGASVNPDMQETIDTVSTDNPELDGKIYCSISPAYVWTLPYILKAKITDKGDEIKSYRFLIRPEQIITYKFNK